MMVIQQAAPLVQKILGVQQYNNSRSYKKSNYCVCLKLQKGMLFFHILTKEMILLSEGEEVQSFKLLVEKRYYVPQELDEKKLTDEVRSIAKMLAGSTKEISAYTIMTTTDCNARCFYCYEAGRSRIFMSKETAMQTAEYIIRNTKQRKASLQWFGGEPLFNSDIIDIICDRLTEEGASFESSMISNGYLFDKAMINRAVSKWKLNQVQITLDGTKEIYLQSKAYIYRDENAFERVLHNIELLLNSKIRVNIRLNQGMHNAEDLLALVMLLGRRFKGREGLLIYPARLYDYVTPLSKEEVKLLDKKAEVLSEQITRLGLGEFTEPLQKKLEFHQCMADSGSAVVIAPDGRLGLCERFSENEFFGRIDSKEIDRAVMESWREHAEPIERCFSCVLYPDCIQVKKCPSYRGCPAAEISDEELKNGIKKQMEEAYRRYQIGEELRTETGEENLFEQSRKYH